MEVVRLFEGVGSPQQGRFFEGTTDQLKADG